MERYFEWDEEKSRTNLRKHGISFEQAVCIFKDPLALSTQDRVVNGEERWQTIGLANSCLLLLVAHTIREEDNNIEIVRIISARRTEPKERRRYERGEI